MRLFFTQVPYQCRFNKWGNKIIHNRLARKNDRARALMQKLRQLCYGERHRIIAKRMARYTNNHQNKMSWLLVLALSVCLTSGLTLEEQVQQLRDNYVSLFADL